MRAHAAPLCLAVVVMTCGCSAGMEPLDSRESAHEPAEPVSSPLAPGVPTGTTLTPSGPLELREAGQVVDGLDVDGCVRVLADDVTIRNSRIRCDDSSRDLVIEVSDGVQGLVVEHSEVDGAGVVDVGVGWTDYTLRWVDIHDVVDGARFGHRVTIEDSWIHDMARFDDLHPDALQTTSASDVVIRRNVLDPRNSETGDLGNAALMLGSETGTREVRDVLVEDNQLDGGNYSVNIRGDISAEGIVIRDNTFGDGARYGEVLMPSSVELGEGNVLERDGASVDPDPADRPGDIP